MAFFAVHCKTAPMIGLLQKEVAEYTQTHKEQTLLVLLFRRQAKHSDGSMLEIKQQD